MYRPCRLKLKINKVVFFIAKPLFFRSTMQSFSVLVFVWCHIISYFPSSKALVGERGLPMPQILLKKTIESDLSTICSMLASTTLKPTEYAAIFDWARNIEFLRAKDSFNKQLSSRFLVMKQGRAIFSRNATQSMEFRRLLFSNDSFRWALESAVNCATEANAWTNHNFALTPEDPSLLQHFMMSAFIDENLVGFCEVAMLPSPKDDEGKYCYYPCISNLVVSPSYRNKGIATKMIRSAIRFIQRHWMHTREISLYVEKANKIAVRLYEKVGFASRRELDDKIYLTKVLDLKHQPLNLRQTEAA